MSVNTTLNTSPHDDEYELNARQQSTSERVAEECNLSADQLLDDLANRKGNIKTGREAVRHSLADAYRLYGLIRNTKNVRESVVASLEEAGKWNKGKRQKLLNSVLSNFLAIDRKRASTYAQVILAALEADIDFPDFISFVGDGGGIDAIAKRHAKKANVSKSEETWSGDNEEEMQRRSEVESPRESSEPRFQSWEDELREFCEINTGFETRPDQKRARYAIRLFVYRDASAFFQVMDPGLEVEVVYDSKLYEEDK